VGWFANIAIQQSKEWRLPEKIAKQKNKPEVCSDKLLKS